MEILHFKEFEDAESVDTNAVWCLSSHLQLWGDTERSRVLGVSNFNSTLAQGVSTLISSCIAMYLKLACHY